MLRRRKRLHAIKKITTLIALIFLSSCHASKTIPYAAGDAKIYKNGLDGYIDAIQEKLKLEKLNFTHVVIVYQPLLREGWKLRFRGIVYDTVTKARYYLIKESGQKAVELTSKNWRFIPMDYILNYHLAGKAEFLKSLNQHGSEGSLVNNIYDINYATRHTQSYQLELVFFDDAGKHMTPLEYFLQNEKRN